MMNSDIMVVVMKQRMDMAVAHIIMNPRMHMEDMTITLKGTDMMTMQRKMKRSPMVIILHMVQ